MLVYLHAFSKRKNSTARPSSSGLEYYGILREQCDTLSPSIGFDLGQDANLAGCNYARIPMFNRYYFIDSWTWADGLWWANMSVDALATWRTEIGDSVNYVLRSSYTYDGGIIDTMYPSKPEYSMYYIGINTSWEDANTPDEGHYIVGIVSASNDAIGATAYYAFDPLEFRGFMYNMLSSTTWEGITFDGNTGLSSDGLTEATFKALFNPFQYIVSCVWVPLNTVVGVAVSDVPLGWWHINAVATRLTQMSLIYSGHCNLPTHPQSSTRGSYLNCSPYTKLNFHIQPFGMYQLNPSCYPNHELYYTVTFDMITGMGRLETTDNVDPNINSDLFVVEQVGIPIQIAQISQNVLPATGNVASAIGGIINSVASKNIGGVIQSLTSGIVSSVDNMTPSVNISGTNGGWSSYMMGSWVQADFLLLVDEDNDTLGRPLCQARTLSSIPGYQMIASPEISIPGTPQEMDTIINYLSTGYFFE